MVCLQSPPAAPATGARPAISTCYTSGCKPLHSVVRARQLVLLVCTSEERFPGRIHSSFRWKPCPCSVSQPASGLCSVAQFLPAPGTSERRHDRGSRLGGWTEIPEQLLLIGFFTTFLKIDRAQLKKKKDSRNQTFDFSTQTKVQMFPHEMLCDPAPLSHSSCDFNRARPLPLFLYFNE